MSRSPRDAAATVRKTAQQLQRGFRRAEGETIREAYSLAQRYTSGFTPRIWFARNDHPLARRHGSPQTELLPLNRQSGVLFGGWRVSGGRVVDGALIYTLTNVAPHAKYQFDPESRQADGGTERTFGRPVPLVIAADIAPGRLARLQQVLRAVLPR